MNLAIRVELVKAKHGSTIAETLAKGDVVVAEAKERRDIAAVRERAAMERVRLARDSRAMIEKMAAWSRGHGE